MGAYFKPLDHGQRIKLPVNSTFGGMAGYAVTISISNQCGWLVVLTMAGATTLICICPQIK